MQYDFNLSPGGGLNLDVKGKFFKYRSGTGPIRVRASKGGYVDLLPGQGVWSLDYNSLNVQDRSGAQNTGVIIAGDFDFHDDRITGTVDILDGGRTRTLAGVAFGASAYQAGVAGQMGAIQIWNGSTTKNIIVGQLAFSSATAQQGAVYVSGTQLLNVSATQPTNKKYGGGASVAQMRQDTHVAVPVGGVITNLSNNVPYKFTEPVLLPPLSGLLVNLSAQNADIAVAFEYFEEMIGV